jgi:uncharacterized membrane protein/Mg-chelatase subunit ChlD
VFRLTLEEGYSLWMMLAVAAGSLLLAGVFYRRAFGMLPRKRWQLLLGLRAVTIVIVVLLLFRPVFSYYEELREKPALLFLLDNSASMNISDDASGATRFQQARENLVRWWDLLKNDFRLSLIVFSQRAAPVDDIRALESIKADGQATSLAAPMLAASQEVSKADRPVAILISDGIHNAARNPVETAGKLGMPVHTIGVGASLRNNIAYRDVMVTGIDCPERLMIHNKAKIVGLVDAVGLNGQVVRVVLEDDGKPIQEQELALDAVEGAQKIEFEFRPDVKGRHTYTVRAAQLAGEKIVENNHRSGFSMVVEPGIRVLYIEGTLRGEYGAIVDRFLAKDPDLEFYAMIQTRPNVFLRRTNIEGLQINALPSDEETINKFDVFILGDLDSSYLKPPQQELMLKRVRAGAGLVMLGGYHSLGPGGYAGTPLGDALPVGLGTREVGQILDPLLPLVTPEGLRHPIFANIGAFFPTKAGGPKESGLPELDGCTRVQAARPGAAVLAVHPTDVNQMPILAVQTVDKGRTAVFCGDTTRKWQQGPRALGQDSPFLRFWGQMVRWLAGRSSAVEAKASVSGSTDKGYYEPEEPIRITAIVRDDKGEGAANAKVIAKVSRVPGPAEEVALVTVPGPGGHHGGTFTPRVAGRYEIAIEARVGEATLAAEKLIVEAGRANLEFEKLDMDEKMLARIAAASGGRYFHINTASSLIEQLDRSQRQKRVYLERPLFWPPAFWAIFVAALTAEWILRRRSQLR